MSITADTSVLVASFASWHQHHDVAVAAVRRISTVVGHCLLETYSVLTRLPAPHRLAPDIVAELIRAGLGSHRVVTLSAIEQRNLVATVAEEGLGGGAIYDALIAQTCVDAKLKLLTLDGRARPTYAVLGAEHELLV